MLLILTVLLISIIIPILFISWSFEVSHNAEATTPVTHYILSRRTNDFVQLCPVGGRLMVARQPVGAKQTLRLRQ